MLITPETNVALLRKITAAITRPAPFPHRPRSGIWEGRGDRFLPSLLRNLFPNGATHPFRVRESVTKSVDHPPGSHHGLR